MALLEGFEQRRVETSGPTINIRTAGSGPPLLLMHGYPQTHVEWRHLAPRLAEEYTVVLADLRGYGDSDKPRGSDTHIEYSKRVMAQDQVEVMQALGHDRFVAIGHDRGGRVAHRMALDSPDRVLGMVVMDIAPTYEMFRSADTAFGHAQFHWFLLAQPYDLPERLLDGVEEYWVRKRVGREGRDFIEEEALQEYIRCFDADAIHGSNEDYRAAATIDLEHDEADLDVKVGCPTLVLWGRKSVIEKRYDVLQVWRDRVADVQGQAVDSGHFVPEEAPEETYQALREFLATRVFPQG